MTAWRRLEVEKNEKMLRRWNYETKEYDIIFVPEEWKCLLYSGDMDVVVNCPHCGKELPFGETYTSMEIHSSMGFGYGVCPKCYAVEYRRAMAHREE